MRILITGASGMLGATLVDSWQGRFDIYATDKSNFSKSSAKNFMDFELLNESFKNLLGWAEPDIIVHCAAITNVDYCEEHPKRAMAVNTGSIVKFLQESPDTRLIFISSEAVFPDGMHLASEKGQTAPENVYGKTKVAGEIAILNAGKPHLALRTTIVGKNINPAAKGFVDWIVNSVKSGNEITLFDDVLFSPITIWQLADELEWIIENEITGIIHVAGTEPVSKYEFGVKICKELGLNTALIQKGSIDDVDFKAKRSKDMTLDTDYYQRLSGRVLPSADNTIASIVKHFKESAYA